MSGSVNSPPPLRSVPKPLHPGYPLPDAWSRKVLLALIRRYGLRPFRYRGQRHTTVMVKAPRRFVEETLSPEFSQILATLRRHLDEITERVVADVIHRDSSEADEVAEPRQLGGRQLGGSSAQGND